MKTSRGKRDLFPLLLILLSLSVQSYFLFAVFDPRLFFYKYWELALRLRGPVLPPLGVFYSSPLYTGTVALAQILGFTPLDLSVVQVFLGTFNCWLMYRFGLIAFDRRVARLAALASVFCLPLLIYTPALLPTVWVTTFNLISLAFLLVYLRGGSLLILAGAGLAMGFSIITHPPGAMFLLLAAAYLLIVGATFLSRSGQADGSGQECPSHIELSQTFSPPIVGATFLPAPIYRGRDPSRHGSGQECPSHIELSQTFSPPIVGATFLSRSIVAAILFLLPAVLITLPVSIYNFARSREIIPVTASGGWVFYCSNNERSRGFDFSPPSEYHDALAAYYSRTEGPRLHYIEHLVSRAIAENRSGKKMSPGKTSRYWFEEGVRFIREHPRAFFSLLAKKAAAAVNGYEPHDVPEILEQARRIAPYPLLSLRVVLPLALAGMIVCRPRGRGLLLLYPASYLLGFLVTYAIPRYRYPLVPVLLLFAAGAVVSLADLVRARDWRKAAVSLFLIAAFAIICNLRTSEMAADERIGRPAFLEEWKGLTALSEGDRAAAAVHFRSALKLNPDSRLSRDALANIK